MVFSFQTDSPFNAASGLQERLSLRSVWQVVYEQTSNIHGQEEQSFGQTLDTKTTIMFKIKPKVKVILKWTPVFSKEEGGGGISAQGAKAAVV